MKKILAITVALALFAAPAFAATFAGGATITTTYGDLSSLSNNVEAAILSGPTGAPSAFAATTAHLNGSKEFGSSSESTKIFSQAYDEAAGLTAPSNSDSTDFTSGTWKAL